MLIPERGPDEISYAVGSSKRVQQYQFRQFGHYHLHSAYDDLTQTNSLLIPHLLHHGLLQKDGVRRQTPLRDGEIQPGPHIHY
jgi:hypothetical protein